MIKVGTLKRLNKRIDEIVETFGYEVFEDAKAQVKNLDYYYGKDRDIDNDDGGYLVFLEDLTDYNENIGNISYVIQNNCYENFKEFDDGFVRVDYMVNNETMISVYMLSYLFHKKE